MPFPIFLHYLPVQKSPQPSLLPDAILIVDILQPERPDLHHILAIISLTPQNETPLILPVKTLPSSC
jgi:hypothetical protein